MIYPLHKALQSDNSRTKDDPRRVYLLSMIERSQRAHVCSLVSLGMSPAMAAREAGATVCDAEQWAAEEQPQTRLRQARRKTWTA